MDCVSFCNIYVIQQDTQYLMINLFVTFSSSTCFGLQQSIFRSLLMLYVAIWYVSIRPVVKRVKKELQFFLHPHNISRLTKSQYTAQERSWRWTTEVRNMLSYRMLWIKLIIKYCVSCWITDILQNDTRSVQYRTYLLVTHRSQNRNPA